MASSRVMRKASRDLFENANSGTPKSGSKNSKSGSKSFDLPAAIKRMFPENTLKSLVFYGQMSESNAARVLNGTLGLPWLAQLNLINHTRGDILVRAMCARAEWWAEYEEGRDAVRDRDLALSAEERLEEFRARRRRRA